MDRRDVLPWQSDSLLSFDGVEVELCVPPALYERESRDGRFILGKSREMIQTMMQVIGDRSVRTIVDLGIYKGGSVVFFNEVFKPWRLMAIERNPVPPPALVHYLERRNPPVGVRLKLGVDQSDRRTLSMLLEKTFNGEPLDLVVDDASHFNFETRESFRALFPLVRPGGLYIIEDWGWAHWRGEYWQDERGGDYFRDKPPLSNLIFEIMLLSASSPGVVSKMTLNGTVAYIERGPDAIEQGFELSHYYFNRGDAIPMLGAARAE